MSDTYRAVYKSWEEKPLNFWDEFARQLPWQNDYQSRQGTGSVVHWFDGGTINACDACVDVHVKEGRGDQTALIFDSNMTGRKERWTYLELQERTARFAGALKENGIRKGDRIIIYMPMIPKAMTAMLACARLGAVHSVVFGGFASEELAKRIDDCAPKAIITASCGLEPGRVIEYMPLVREAQAMAKSPAKITIVAQRKNIEAPLLPGELDFDSIAQAASPAPCEPVDSQDPLYILYTSGTTGKPKGVVRETGGYLAALKWSMSNVFGAEAGDVYWAASDIGWVVGHSYIIYGPLLQGCTTVMYEGKPVGTPDAGQFWRIINDYQVNVFFTAPTAFRAIKRVDAKARELARYDISSLNTLFLAGERADPDTILWLQNKLSVPVIDHWWQTELGWPALACCAGLGDTDARIGSAGKPVPGYHFACLDPDGGEVPRGNDGALVIRLPLPPGCATTLWNDPDRYAVSYLEAYPGYYLTGDAGKIDDDGFVHVMGRTDDVINVAGHRLSTGGMEEILAEHPAVAECAVVGAADELKGQCPLGFVILKDGITEEPSQIISELISEVRTRIGAVASFRNVMIVSRLPKTRSGKILRRTLKQIADGQDYTVPATIDDPTILSDIEALFKAAA